MRWKCGRMPQWPSCTKEGDCNRLPFVTTDDNIAITHKYTTYLFLYLYYLSIALLCLTNCVSVSLRYFCEVLLINKMPSVAMDSKYWRTNKSMNGCFQRLEWSFLNAGFVHRLRGKTIENHSVDHKIEVSRALSCSWILCRWSKFGSEQGQLALRKKKGK